MIHLNRLFIGLKVFLKVLFIMFLVPLSILFFIFVMQNVLFIPLAAILIMYIFGWAFEDIK